MIFAYTPPPVPVTNIASTAIVRTAETTNTNTKASAQANSDAALNEALWRELGENSDHNINTGLRVYDEQRNIYLSNHDYDRKHYAASINKLPVALLLLHDLNRGKLQLDQTLSWSVSDRLGGYGDFDKAGASTSASLQDVTYDMLNKSGNTAVRVLVAALGGPEQVNARLSAFGTIPNTHLEPVGGGHFYMGYTTATDAMWVMAELALRTPGPNTTFMVNAMATNIFNDFGVRSQIAGRTHLQVTNKVGILNEAGGNNRHDVGVIHNYNNGKTYVYSILNTGAASGRSEASLKEMGFELLQYADASGGHGGAAPKIKDVKSERTLQLVHPEARVLY